MMRAAIVFGTALALAGCVGAPLTMPLAHDAPATLPAAPAPEPVVKTIVQQVCLKFEPWSAADLRGLAAAIPAIPDNSLVKKAVLDWRRYYGDAKACVAAQGKG
jgi:hypothetical protein